MNRQRDLSPGRSNIHLADDAEERPRITALDRRERGDLRGIIDSCA